MRYRSWSSGSPACSSAGNRRALPTATTTRWTPTIPSFAWWTRTGTSSYARKSNWSKIALGQDGIETVDFRPNPEVRPGNYWLIGSGAGISSFPSPIEIKHREVKGSGD